MADVPVSHEPMPSVLHIIGTLGVGGAEQTLRALVNGLSSPRYEHQIVTILPKDAVPAQAMPGVRVDALDCSSPAGLPGAIRRLRALVRDRRPDVVHSWNYHANVLTVTLPRERRPAVVWGIRHGALDRRTDGRSTRAVAMVGAAASRYVPEVIAVCAGSALRSHAAVGYSTRRMEVLPNGIDVAAFRPRPEERRALRVAMGIDGNGPLVMHGGRYHPTKDYQTLLRSFEAILECLPTTRFALCGEGVTWDNASLVGLLSPRLRESTSLLGPQRMHDVLPAADIVISSSRVEAFPNVIAEAMACGVPVVATRAGDSADIIGSTGVTVARGDALGLAHAAVALLDDESLRESFGASARRRIVEEFDLAGMLDAYDLLYRGLAPPRIR